jgi:hypothetical protein
MSPEQSMANIEKKCQIINHLLAIFTFSSHFTHFGSVWHGLQGTVLQALRLNVEKIMLMCFASPQKTPIFAANKINVLSKQYFLKHYGKLQGFRSREHPRDVC